MIISEHWPTAIGQVNFEQPGLLEYLLTTYDLKNMNDRDTNILDSSSDIIKSFRDSIYTYLSDYILTTSNVNSKKYNIRLKGWVTGNTRGYSMIEHNHSGAQFSMVYYPLCETENVGGEIHFTDPRTNANRGFPPEFHPLYTPIQIQPKSGDLIIFPSFLYHYVSAYHQQNRIAIPIDIFLEDRS